MRSENLFTEEVYIYSDKVFFIKFFDREKEKIVKLCFEIIEDMGLGANKNLGWGCIKIRDVTNNFLEEITFLSKKLKHSARFMTLSPVLPRRDSLDLRRSYYRTETYKSPVDTTFGGGFIWKKKTLYLSEGSTLMPSKEGWTGELREVGTEDIKAFQYGYEFPICVEG
jgi:CRISPR-associated protein Csm4